MGKKTVKTMPGVFFLSGETKLDEDNEETATLNLNAMNRDFKDLPFHVSFSFGKAENVQAAQTALYNRCKANSEANKGTYVAGSCASIGVDGNIKGAGGAY